MKRKIVGLDPIHGMTKSEASYERLMLEMMSKLVAQTRENNNLMRQHFGNPTNKSHPGLNATTFNMGSGLPMKVSPEKFSIEDISPKKQAKVEDVYESTSGKNLKMKTIKQSSSSSNLKEDSQQQVSIYEAQPVLNPKMQKILQSLELRLKAGEEINKKLLQKIQKLETSNEAEKISRQKVSVKDLAIANTREEQKALIEKAISDKFNKNQEDENNKKSSYILSEILPYSDRREIKIKFKITDIIDLAEKSHIEQLKNQTSEWLGQVYRATASICWNMLLNQSLSFEEVKILFTENIIFNFVEFMKDVSKIGAEKLLQEITSIVNKKSVSILDFLCRQYPQTKIEAPNLALRSILPQIDNQGRSKYDLVCNSGISFRYREDGDYTAQIMRMINFMIERGNQQYDGFVSFMRDTFEEIYIPIHKRRKEENKYVKEQIQLTHDDYLYRDKVKSYTKYLIGRKIPKNTQLYTEEQIEDGVFFVKSNAVLRIVTKWVEQLKEYFEDPDKKIKYNYNQNKDHDGNVMYLSALLKNGIYDQILKNEELLFQKINKIRQECEKMEYLLANENYTTDPSQVHLSQEQICVGMYSCNIKGVISSYICSQLNQLIHFLLKVPIEVPEDSLGNDLEVFQAQARKELDSVNLITFKLSDLLRCKIHSNEEEIIWIVQYLLYQSQNNRKKFKVVRIKDRLGLGTRDIMINAQINKGLTCQIQLAVTSTSDKKQQLLDSYNHFLYELKRSQLGSIIQNVSIWSNLEQRFLYFEQIQKKKKKQNYTLRKKSLNHKCGSSAIQSFKRPLICYECKKFFPIPKTCLLSVFCKTCGTTFCGQCYYYNYLDPEQRKKFLFDGHRLLKQQVMNQLIEYTDYSKPLPATGFFIKKDFLTKQLSFYMAIEKDKKENVKDAPHIQILVIQTIIKNDTIFNRQVNKKEIYAKLEKGQFFIKNYEKTQLNSFIIFYFEKPQLKKKMTLKDLQTELEKETHGKAKVLNILKEPSYIPSLHLLKKQTDKTKELHYLKDIIGDGKIIVFAFHHFYLLAQVLVKGSELRAEIRKRVNMGELKKFAEKETDIVSMEFKNMTTELCDIAIKWKPKLYSSFCENLKKLFLSNGTIESIKCFQNFTNLQTVFINENKLTSLQGIQNLKNLMSFRFDYNKVESLEYFTNNTSMRYISANSNKITSLKGLQKLTELRSLSIYENKLTSLEEIRNHKSLDELYLRDNPLTDLSVVQTIPTLTKLFIGKTQPKSLPDLSALKNLLSLSLQNLNLESIPPIFNSLLLHDLSLSNNNIKQMTNLNSQTELVNLNLNYNQITEIKDIDNLDKLEVLKIHHNQINVVKGIKNLESLKYLSLKDNPIDDIGDLYSFQIAFNYALTQETISEKAKKQLAELQISKNSISSSED